MWQIQRNWFDVISILLLAACVGTHIGDIIDHSEILARAHIRVMSITIIFIALRLLKVGRLINEVTAELLRRNLP
jgi:hypothetical protein